jgi:hypothetical protein
MNAQAIAPIIKACFTELRAKLARSEQIAKAALACPEAASLSESIRVSMEIEQLVYDVGRIDDAACLLGRYDDPETRA